MKPAHALCTLFGLSILATSCKSKPAPKATPVTPATPTPTLTAAQPTAPPPQPSLDGTYTNMKVLRGQGDAIGVEITVSNSQGAASVTFQCAQGELSQPQLSAAQVTGTTVHFKTRDNSQCPGAAYTATIADETLSLARDGATVPPEVLKHVTGPGDRPKP